ncbi:hypothetical protein [Sphaerisporangium sp. TRM90804]|uniref:hypothetical protein n=1 Tax=Sphaerisporangium sp. TRM90804 TaxID=3031113 RepID=UPI002447DAA2|nr:hypothetical protein [Sphaerisporangium sp. TRM90804]MDH2425068.1 hypothetical protein [Sphaerisporangium sp. TRM90804]
MPDHVDVHGQTAFAGLARWDAATSDIAAFWKERAERIRRLTEAAPWGRDSAGQAFQASYTRGGGPEGMLLAGDGIVSDVGHLGMKVRTAVVRTRDTDQRQAGTTYQI